MRGEITALISVIAFALSYIFVNKAQTEGETSDNGLLPVLVISSVVLILSFLFALLRAPAEFHMAPKWRMPILYCVLAGVSWNFVSRMTLLASIYRIGATRGIVIKASAPVMTVAMAVAFFGERLDVGDIIGFIFICMSIALLVTERIRTHERSWLPKVVVQGILLGLISALFQSIGHLLRKIGADFAPPLLGASLDMTAATLAYILYLIWTKRLAYHTQFYLRRPSRHILMASVLSAVGVLTSFVSVASAPISTVAMILAMQPMMMPMLSSLCFLGLEKFTWVAYLSTALAVCGAVSIILFNPKLLV
ncbi:MAG: DMT family transporter [Alicyclobacillus sp.]|nr:DMT family transporter [Alicyclobacillus sp.]